MIKHIKQNKVFLIGLFFLSFVLNISFFYFFLRYEKEVYITQDSRQYHEQATQIATGKGISHVNGDAYYYRVPGYAIFLACCYKLFNFDIEKSLYFQMFIASFIPILVFFLSLSFFPFHLFLAKISSLFMALHVGTILFAGSLMTESIFMIFFYYFLFCFFQVFNSFFVILIGMFYIIKNCLFLGFFWASLH